MWGSDFSWMIAGIAVAEDEGVFARMDLGETVPHLHNLGLGVGRDESVEFLESVG